jgi:Mg2+-importing ATPase
VAVATGPATELGRLARHLHESAPRTGFEQGITRFGLLLARITMGVTAAILALNLLLDRPFTDALLFSLALAIGLTPQMLPAIVSVSLATGARRMARKRVIVRRLDAIEDFGAMDVLCTDKTGTLTDGVVRLHAALDLAGSESPLVVARAAVSAALQTGFTNPIDAAILARVSADPRYRAVDEVPFDFTRKRLSVLVDGPEGRLLITKGAFASVLAQCTTVRGAPSFAAACAAAVQRFDDLSGRGFRVLALAERPLPHADRVTIADECDLELLGFLVFADPPKAGVDQTLRRLADAGIRVCMLTGDNRLAAAHVGVTVGIDASTVLTGNAIDALDDSALVRAAASTSIFAELDPLQKERVIRTLRRGGATVGYLGDGINDAGALHLADVGISVDTAVDVAKSAAAIVLLDKDLGVLSDGVKLGRETFANTIKYVFTTVSANFGNMASMAAASAFLPFLPLLPRQILLLNLLSDVPSMTIAVDRVDREACAGPQRWDIRFVRDAMIAFGLLSSAFDLLTFAILLQVFRAGPDLFRSGWFVGSTLTELAVLLALRTRRAALRSRPGTLLLVTSVAVAAATIVLPYTAGLASALGLVPLPGAVLATLGLVTAGYVASAEVTKRAFYALERPPRVVRLGERGMRGADAIAQPGVPPGR